jgi:hypothetical protein
VTPRFPDGLTVYETTGQWRDPATKAVTRERSRVLRIIVPADTARDKIDAVAGGLQEAIRADVGRHRHAAGLRLVLSHSKIVRMSTAIPATLVTPSMTLATVSIALVSAGGGCCCCVA